MKVLGIDPGLSGGLALLDDAGNLVTLEIPSMKSSGRGRQLNWQLLVDSFDVLGLHEADHCFLEQVNTRPNEARSAAFKFGTVYGGLIGIIAADRIPLTLVTPAKWKKKLSVTAEKDSSRARACQIFPNNASSFARKKDDGVAEAALIAHYGLMELRGRHD